MEYIEVKNKLTEIFRSVFNNELIEITNNLTANDIEMWDSLSHMILITEIENAFLIKFKLKDLNKMKNVGDMIEIINSKL